MEDDKRVGGEVDNSTENQSWQPKMMLMTMDLEGCKGHIGGGSCGWQMEVLMLIMADRWRMRGA